MKKKIGVSLLILMLVLTAGCSGGREAEAPAAKPVKVAEVKNESAGVALDYLGVVAARELKKLGFKMAGVLEDVAVSKGAAVAAGDTLAALETKDLELAVQASQNTRDNAQKAYEFAQDNFDKINRLFEAGAVSAAERDKAEVEMVNLRSGYNNAQIDYQNKQNLLADSILKSDISGFVADILYEEGEMAPAGYPVVILRSSGLEVTVGLAQDDLQKVKAGTAARVLYGDMEIAGEVTAIGQLPDTSTRTYPATVAIEDTTLPLGVTAEVLLELGEEEGIYIPISAIQNNGRDYVYVVDAAGFAQKKEIELGRVHNSKVLVTGLAEGDKLVIEGGKRLNEGDPVIIQ